MNIPEPILHFIKSKTVAGPMLLPFHYPEPEHWLSFQSAFRYNGVTGEDLTSTKAGEWQPGWYVIALNGFDDPFFINLEEEAAGFPVYYSEHDAGVWEPLIIAEDLVRFGMLLAGLEALKHDAQSSLQYIQLMHQFNGNSPNEFWAEVCESLAEQPEESPQENNSTPDPALWTRGQLILIHAGANKVKVAQYLRKIWHVGPQEALARLSGSELILTDGYLAHLRKYETDLLQLGATVEFRVEANQHARESIIIEGQQAWLVPMVALMAQLPEDSLIRKYQKERYTTERAIIFEQDTVLDTLDLDNPFSQLTPDWMERYVAAVDAGDETARKELDAEYERQSVFQVFVAGNLTVNRYISNTCIDGAAGLVVLGNLSCGNIIVGGQEIYVQNNLHVKELYWGEYNHGNLTVKGNMQAGVLVQSDYTVSVAGAQLIGHYFDDCRFESDSQPGDIFCEEILSRSGGGLISRLNKIEMLKRLADGLSVLKETGNSVKRIFENYDCSIENLLTFTQLKLVTTPHFLFHVEDVIVVANRENDEEGSLHSILLRQDNLRVFIYAKREEEKKTFMDKLLNRPPQSPRYHLKKTWKAPDGDWYEMDHQTPQEEQQLLRNFWPLTLQAMEEMDRLTPQEIESCQQLIQQVITPAKISDYLSKPIVNELYNDYYESDRMGYWSDELHFSFRQNINNNKGRIQIVMPRPVHQLKLFPSVTGNYDIRGYQFDLETDEHNHQWVSIRYLPHDVRGSYPLTPLDVKHYRKALNLWRYFEEQFPADNERFENGEWDAGR